MLYFCFCENKELSTVLSKRLAWVVHSMQGSWKLTLMCNIKQMQMLLLLFLFKLQMENIEEAS